MATVPHAQTLYLLSRIFDPFVVGTGITALAIGFSSLGLYEQMRFFAFLILVVIGIPVCLLLVAIKLRLISDWDVRKREQRPALLVGLLCIESINLFLIRAWGDPFLFRLFLFYVLWIVGFLIITLFYKISGHLGVLALGCMLILLWYGVVYWPVCMTVPFLAWVRIAGKYHTLGQVVAGVVYSVVSVLIFRSFLIP